MIRRITNFIRNIVITSTSVPTLTCTKCWKKYRYTGVVDFDNAICPDCRKKFTGGPYDGKEVWEIDGS